MNGEIVTYVVLGVVALGTYLYYAFRDNEKERPQETRSSTSRSNTGHGRRNSNPEIHNGICFSCNRCTTVELLPCEHKVFCQEHYEYFLNISDELKRVPRCPRCRERITNCR